MTEESEIAIETISIMFQIIVSSLRAILVILLRTEQVCVNYSSFIFFQQNNENCPEEKENWAFFQFCFSAFWQKGGVQIELLFVIEKKNNLLTS